MPRPRPAREDDHDFTPPREYLGVYLERRRESGFQLYNTLGIARGDKAAYAKQALENYNFFGAPHVAIIHTDEALGIYGAIDCGAYVGNFMLAAQALGLGTIPQAALARHSGLSAGISGSPMIAGWCAAFRLVSPTMTTGQQLSDVTGGRRGHRDVYGGVAERLGKESVVALPSRAGFQARRPQAARRLVQSDGAPPSPPWSSAIFSRSSIGSSTSASAPRRNSSVAACHSVLPIGMVAIRQPSGSVVSSMRVRAFT